MNRPERFLVWAAVATTLAVALVVACSPKPAAPPPAQGGSPSWVWQLDGGYGYYTPGRGYAWQLAAPVVPARAPCLRPARPLKSP